MKKLLSMMLLLLTSSFAIAQTTDITATVVDSDSTVWANAPWVLSFQPGPNQSNPANYTIGGVALTHSVAYQNGTADGSGVVTFTTYTSTSVQPIGSSWNLQVCPKASTPCATINFSTSASSQDISTQVNAAITAPRFQAVAGAYGYNDTEAQVALKPGNTYWNVTSDVSRCYTGSAWGACSTGGGGGTIGAGTTGEFPYYAADGTTLTATNAVIYEPLLPRLQLGSPVDGSVTDGVSVWLNSNIAAGDSGQVDVESGAISLLVHGESATSGKIIMHADTNLPGDNGGSVEITASSVDPANGGNLAFTATGAATVFAPTVLIKNSDPSTESAVTLQANSVTGSTGLSVQQDSINFSTNDNGLVDALADININTNYGQTGHDSGNISMSAHSDDPANGGKISLTSTGPASIIAPNVLLPGLTGVGTKAPLCINTDGTLYLGNNTGTGAPCP